MKHARDDYNRIQDPALRDPSLLAPGSNPIGEDEPVMLFRAKDLLAPEVLEEYSASLLENALYEDDEVRKGQLRHMSDLVEEQAGRMREWQRLKGSKLPDLPAVEAPAPKVQKVTIYGASDDLIEIDGDIQDEFYPDEAEGLNYLAFGDGSVLSIEYAAGGFWRVNRVKVGTATYSKTEATDESNDYSDKVTLEGDLRWVLMGRNLTSE